MYRVLRDVPFICLTDARSTATSVANHHGPPSQIWEKLYGMTDLQSFTVPTRVAQEHLGRRAGRLIPKQAARARQKSRTCTVLYRTEF